MKCSFVWMVTLTVLGTSGALAAAPLHWYRCNTHTHTSNPPHSDANETPDFVAEWYRSHGYQCLVITDHEFLTDVGPINRHYAATGDFLVLQGQEITQQLADPARPDSVRQLHVNGINVNKTILPIGYPQPAQGISPLQAYERNIDAIIDAGGIVQINHPNLQWSVRLNDLLPLSQPFLLEVWNAFPTSNNLGGTDDAGNQAPSAESLWDSLLSKGKVVWGVASDDAHSYHSFDDRESPTPGKGWITIRAPSLTVAYVTEALRRGDFYASTGITLNTYSSDDHGISITIERNHEWSPKLKPGARFVTRFVGADGRLLAEVTGMSPQYRFRGDEKYVRASIMDSDGRRAWTQPVFLDHRLALISSKIQTSTPK
jgi:hypothetical protein